MKNEKKNMQGLSKQENTGKNCVHFIQHHENYNKLPRRSPCQCALAQGKMHFSHCQCTTALTLCTIDTGQCMTGRQSSNEAKLVQSLI